MVGTLVIDRSAVLVLSTCEIDNELFFGDKILHLESDFRKFGFVAVLRSLVRILRASLAQNDTEKVEKYAKLGKAANFVAYTISEEAIRFRHPDYDPDRAQK